MTPIDNVPLWPEHTPNQRALIAKGLLIKPLPPEDDSEELMALLLNRWECIETLRDQIAQLERQQVEIVTQLRADHVTWECIGNATGTSKQAAQQRYGKP